MLHLKISPDFNYSVSAKDKRGVATDEYASLPVLFPFGTCSMRYLSNFHKIVRDFLAMSFGLSPVFFYSPPRRSRII